MTDLRDQLILMAAEGHLYEIGAQLPEIEEIMLDPDVVVAGVMGMGDPYQWAMMRLARLRDAQSAEQRKE